MLSRESKKFTSYVRSANRPNTVLTPLNTPTEKRAAAAQQNHPLLRIRLKDGKPVSVPNQQLSPPVYSGLPQSSPEISFNDSSVAEKLALNRGEQFVEAESKCKIKINHD